VALYFINITNPKVSSVKYQIKRIVWWK